MPDLRRIAKWLVISALPLGAALFGILGIGIFDIFGLLKSEPEGKLIFDQLSIEETDGFPELNVRLLNEGDGVATFKQIDLRVEQVWAVEPILRPAPDSIVPNWESDVVLRTQKEGTPYSLTRIPTIVDGETTAFTFYHIPPDGRHGFKVRLGNDAPEQPIDYFFLMTLIVIYDEDNKTETSERILFATRGNGVPNTLPLWELKPEDEEKIDKAKLSRAKEVIAEIKKIEGMRSEGLNLLIEAISSIPM